MLQVGSIVGLVASPWHGVYSSSKAAVHNLTDALRLELAPFGIQVGGGEAWEEQRSVPTLLL